MPTSVIPLKKPLKPRTAVPEDRAYAKTTRDFMLANPFSGAALDPGLGKTRITLDVLSRVPGKTLLISGIRICQDVWPAEIEKWGFKLSSAMLHGRKKEDALYSGSDILLLNYEGLPWLMQQCAKYPKLLQKIGVKNLVVDESTRFKNPRAITRLKMLKRLLPVFERRHILTGTIIPKSYLDLWAQIFILDRGASLGEYFTHYKMKHFYQHDFQGFDWRLRNGAEETILAAVKHLLIRFDRDELDLPPLVNNTVRFVLSPVGMKAYRQMENKLEAEVRGGLITAKNAAVATTKCRQLSNGVVYNEAREAVHVHSDKIDALVELVERSGSPVMVLYEFTHEGDALEKALKTSGLHALRIAGGQSMPDFVERKRAWNAGELDVLLCQMTVVSHGLNLQDGGHTVCWFSIPFNLEVYQQAIQRLWRSGQKHKVINHHLVAVDTVDEIAMGVLSMRAGTQKSFLDALKRRFS